MNVTVVHKIREDSVKKSLNQFPTQCTLHRFIITENSKIMQSIELIQRLILICRSMVKGFLTNLREITVNDSHFIKITVNFYGVLSTRFQSYQNFTA
jgi:hypothetical protein